MSSADEMAGMEEDLHRPRRLDSPSSFFLDRAFHSFEFRVQRFKKVILGKYSFRCVATTLQKNYSFLNRENCSKEQSTWTDE